MDQIEKVPWRAVNMGSEIGTGAHGRIMNAMLRTEGTRVAVKKFFERCVNEEDELGRFDAKGLLLHEAKMMSRLRHPNILSLHAIACNRDEIDDKAGLVMEYMGNRDLESCILQDKGFVRLPWRQRVMIAIDAAAGMDYMHSMGIIHFDLKASNILLDRYFDSAAGDHVIKCKICDFGLAREKQDDMSFMRGLGTLAWMAPEMDDATLAITEKADVFSFGLVLYLLVTGLSPKPFLVKGRGIRLAEPRPCPSSVQPSYQSWRALMNQCLAWDAARRPSFAEVGKKLKLILASLNKRPRDDYFSIRETFDAEKLRI